MWQFGILAVLLEGLGTGVGIYVPENFTPGGWCGAAVYFLAAFPFRAIALQHNRSEHRQ